MRIVLDSLIEGAERASGIAVIIDVFRAFTVEAVAFQRGAKKIILVSTPQEAISLRQNGIVDLCVGELHGRRPDGFDFNNSPYEISQTDLNGKTLAHSTMAGTVGVNAARNADLVYVASLVIARATADAILRDSPELVTIVAMGDAGKDRTDEDEQCALYIRNLLEGRQPDSQAVRSLIISGNHSAKYEDPAQPHFHPEDRRAALEIDSASFAIRVLREEGTLVARPVRL